jgi:type I restriction enzyme S subunit
VSKTLLTFDSQREPLHIHQNHVFRVRFDCQRFDPRFLATQFASPYAKAYFLARAKRTTGIATINQKVLAAFPLLIPPLPEQRRIVAILNEQMAAVERARAAVEAQLEAAKALPRAYLRAVFESEDAKRWPKRRLGEVCDFLDSRRIPVKESERQKRIAGKSISDLYPYYGANGQAGWIDGYLFDEPTILLAEDGGFFGSRTRPIAYAVHGKYWVNNHAHVLRPRAFMDFQYCLHALRIRPDVLNLISGTTRAKLPQEAAAQIEVPCPEKDVQVMIGKKLIDVVSKTERLARDLEDEAVTINHLQSALLCQAFEGGL